MESVEKIPNRLLVLGNGFDLGLGRATKYSDFAKSEFWPKNLTSDLYKYLNGKANIEKWFDLEGELAEYTRTVLNECSAYRSTIPGRAQQDENDFQVIVEAMSNYLKVEEGGTINKDSMAAKVFTLACEDSAFSKIYSFNYTNLQKLANILKTSEPSDVEYVHGCLLDNTAILGINDTIDTVNGYYDFLRKSFNPHYSSHPVAYDLKNADEVVFFGHSLGTNDFHYFQSFFRHQCEENLAPTELREITIFTKNAKSRLEILRTLHEMNGRRTSLLFQNNKLSIFCTDDGETNSFCKWYAERVVEIDRCETREFFEDISRF